MAATSNAAHEAWSRTFGSPKIEQPLTSPNDTGPLQLTSKLGEGGWGNVYRTQLDGVAVALKLLHLFPNQQRNLYANKLKILQKLSGSRHRHIIELIGCFELVGRLRSRIGLVIWPVAQCDLSSMLHCMDILSGLKSRLTGGSQVFDPFKALDEEELHAFDTLYALAIESGRARTIENGFSDTTRTRLLSSPASSLSLVKHIHEASVTRLYTAFGCLAHAVSHLHQTQRIRHKDLNPKQILLSSTEQLWLTDFGLAKDISGLSGSGTNSGGKASFKYHAPERESRGQLPCGRSEDIFALGCTYLEMCYRIYDIPIEQYLNPHGQRSWTYHATLHNIDNWLEPFQKPFMEGPQHPAGLMLVKLIKEMMARDSGQRPTIEHVLSRLEDLQTPNGPIVFGMCCHSRVASNASRKSDLPASGTALIKTQVYDREKERELASRTIEQRQVEFERTTLNWQLEIEQERSFEAEEMMSEMRSRPTMDPELELFLQFY